MASVSPWSSVWTSGSRPDAVTGGVAGCGAGASRRPAQTAVPTTLAAATPAADSTACRRTRRRRTAARRATARSRPDRRSADRSSAARASSERRSALTAPPARVARRPSPRWSVVVPRAASSRLVPSAVYRFTAPSLSPSAAAVSRIDMSSTWRSTTHARSRGASVCRARWTSAPSPRASTSCARDGPRTESCGRATLAGPPRDSSIDRVTTARRTYCSACAIEREPRPAGERRDQRLLHQVLGVVTRAADEHRVRRRAGCTARGPAARAAAPTVRSPLTSSLCFDASVVANKNGAEAQKSWGGLWIGTSAASTASPV